MAVTLKKMYQGTLSTSVIAKYTCPADTQAQVVDILLVNQNATTVRKVSVYAHGTASINIIYNNIEIPAADGVSIGVNRIILEAGEVLAFKQDVGTDVVATIYGIEEALA